ncbi:MAG: DNA translocase FtsK 4TM domain-containing protein [Caldilineaceae bacterium]|nr:DNA translocase FtsK 4TM domain-containing protein [Caldilineaceae bacterium]
MAKRRSNSDYDNQFATSGWRILRENLRLEALGLALAILGLYLLVTVVRYVPARAAAPFLTVLTGWTAPLVASSLVVIGLVILFRRRAGYWSAEALVGVELLLLGLMAVTHIAGHRQPDWNGRLAGEDGGLVGWMVGNMLVTYLGYGLATFIAISLAVAGLAMLLRYTPLIYGAAAVGRWLPQVPGWWATLERTVRRDRDAGQGAALPRTPNFVPAAPEADRGPASEPAVETKPVRGRRKGAAGSAATSPVQPEPLRPTSKRAEPAPARAPRPAAKLPPHDFLRPDAGEYGNADVKLMQQMIVSTLEDFNVPVRVVHVETGPTVTQFGVEPLYTEAAGHKRKVRVSRIVNLADDLALALAAPAVRIEAPVPGRPYVGIEVPNPDKSLVSLRGILSSPEMQKGGALALALGRNTAGAPVVIDLTRAPHVLIAGATGSGKSVCINTIITGLLMQHGPESLRFVMVDPKMVELPGYNGIPHLYGKVITDIDQVMGALTWLMLQMDDRYQMFRDVGVRNIDSYNAHVRGQKGGEPLPYIVLVIDELADLMMTAADDVERQICRLAQMARATGIHLILATQRPSTDVITGLIKANFPTRISFAVTSQIDSRVILDTPGAERLLGRGDMLLMRPDAGKLQRVQGCFVADEEINRIVSFWRADDGSAQRAKAAPWMGILDQLDNESEFIQDAMDVLRGMRTCSTSMLQRKLNIGYPKAARLMEELEKLGAVGPDLGGGRGREVLLESDEDEADEDETL